MSQTGKPPILLVDDEPEMLFSLKALLRREFELHTAQSGREALEILRSREIHVVMTDQRMPEMTGVQLMRRIKDDYPDIIRIVFTGYADIRAVVEAINFAGLYRYITKPWDPDELVDLLREAAVRYEEVARRARLLELLRDHVRMGGELARSLGKTPIASGDGLDLQNFVAESGQLLEQLEAVLHTRANPAGTS